MALFSARFPIVPLPWNLRNRAKEYELVLDYETGELFVTKPDSSGAVGDNRFASIADTIAQIITSSGTLSINSLTVTVNGEDVKLQTIINELTTTLINTAVQTALDAKMNKVVPTKELAIATLNSDGSISASTITVQELLDSISDKLPISGGVMTGLLTLSGAPTDNLHAATKEYVDSNKITVDQTYSATSTNAQSGTAVTEAFTKNYITAGKKEGTTLGTNATAEGFNTTASGDGSHAEGGVTTASGSMSHAEGYDTVASGLSSHAEGYSTMASEKYSHAEGYNTKASGTTSHAEGRFTTASGKNSHAEGQFTTASGQSSHAEGYNTKASSDYQHVQGKYNIEDNTGTYLHIVGNGTDGTDDNRSNAHTLDINGNAWFAGKVTADGTPTNDNDLTTKAYVDTTKESLHSSSTITLATASWTDLSQSITLSGITTTNDILVSPEPASIELWSKSRVYCSAQAADSLTFTCKSAPTADITVNVLIMGGASQ